MTVEGQELEGMKAAMMKLADYVNDNADELDDLTDSDSVAYVLRELANGSTVEDIIDHLGWETDGV